MRDAILQIDLYDIYAQNVARAPVVGLIKWLRPKDLKVCSYVKK